MERSEQMNREELKPCPFCQADKGNNCICPDMITKDAKDAWQNANDISVTNILNNSGLDVITA